MAYIDLKYLENMAGGDPEIIQEMKDLFIAQVPEFVENLKKASPGRKLYRIGKRSS